MAPKNKARQKPGSMRSRQQAKLNSQKAQKAPIQPAPRTGPRRQLPPSSQGQSRVGNSSQPWGEQQRSGNEVRQVRVRVERPQLPGTAPKPERTAPQRALPAAGESTASKPSGVQNPGTSRRPPTRQEMAADKLRRAAQGSSPSGVRVARGKGTSRLTPEGMFAGPRVGAGVNKALAIANLAMMTKDMAQKAADPKFWEAKSKEIKQRAEKDKAQKTGSSNFDEKSYASKQKFSLPKPADKKPAGVKTASQQPTTTTRPPAARVSSPAPKPQPKAVAQSYRDAEDTKGLSVGRYRTLAEHRAAVQAAKALKIGGKTETNQDLYTPSSKVDGSKLDTSKVSAKLDEFDKKKRKRIG